MANSSPQRTSIWERDHSAASGHAFLSGLDFVLTIPAEFRRAAAAMRRYEQLKRTARARNDPEINPARRIYVEFYSGE